MSFHFRRALNLTGIITPSVYVGLTVAIHLLNPGDPWMRYTLSDLALTRYGWIETLSLCVLAVGVIAVAFSLYRNARRRRENVAALAMFGIVSLALLLIAGFKASDTAVVTPVVLVHRASVGVLTITFPAACLLMVPALRADPRWRNLAWYSALTGTVGIVLAIVGASLPHDLQQSVAGLWEKVFITTGVIWCQVFAVKLFLVSRAKVAAVEKSL